MVGSLALLRGNVGSTTPARVKYRVVPSARARNSLPDHKQHPSTCDQPQGFIALPRGSDTYSSTSSWLSQARSSISLPSSSRRFTLKLLASARERPASP